MTTHLCQIPKKLSWEQIKRSILGRQRLSDNYVCGGCCKTFETVCCLHFHCMKHNGGGSYYFDHVTNTAFPKFDTRCSSSQFEEDDCNGEQLMQNVLTGHARSINDDVSCLNLPVDSETSPSVADIKVASDVDHLERSDYGISDAETGTDTNEVEEEDCLEQEPCAARRKEDNGKVFAFVKVRNIIKGDDGSITFEMDEKDSHLFDETATTIVEQLKTIGKDRLQKEHELKVFVPEKCITESDNVAEKNQMVDSNSSDDIGSINTTDVPSDPTDGSHLHVHVGNESEVYNSKLKEIDDTVNDTVETLLTVSAVSGKDNSEHSSDQCAGDSDYLVTDKDKDCNHDNVKNMKGITRTKGKRKEDNVDGLNISPNESVIRKPNIEQKITKTHGKSKNLKQLSEEAHILTRSSRKRKMTVKMQESELKNTLKNLKTEDPLKIVLANVSASKTLFSLSSTERSRRSSAKNESSSPLSMEIKQEKNVTITKSKTHQLDRTEISLSTNVVMNLCDDNEKRHLQRNEAFTENNHKYTRNVIEKVIAEEKTEFKSPQIVKHVKQEEHNITSNVEKPDLISKEKYKDLQNVEHTACSVLVPKGGVENTLKRRRKRLEYGSLPLCKRTDMECRTCGKVGTIGMVRYHEQMHSSKLLYKCDECGKCFKTAACKRSHVRQHGEKKWTCEQCPAAFYRKQYLDTHMTKHTGETPYVCELCGMKFKMRYILRRHVNSVHNNIRNFKCDICQKDFFRAATRDVHRNRHFEPFLQCSYCPKKFKGDLDVRKHELTHTGEKLYFCPLCNQGFSQIWPYYKHMWKIHNIQKDEAKEMRIKNPDIVHLRNINTGAVKKEQGYGHEFIGKPGQTFEDRKSFSQNTQKFIINEGQRAQFVYTTDVDENNVSVQSDINTIYSESSDLNAIYAGTSSDLTDTIVLDINEDIDTRETIVIHTDDLQNVDNPPGYIVVDDSQSSGNIVIYSEFPQNEIEDDG